MENPFHILEVTSRGRPTRDDLLALLADAMSGLPASLRDPAAAAAYADKLLAHAVLVVGQAGLVALYANDERFHRAFLTLVVVKPGARGQGAGRALLTAAMAYLRDRNFRTIAAEVRKDNPHAVALYNTLGFTALEETVDFVRLEAAL